MEPVRENKKDTGEDRFCQTVLRETIGDSYCDIVIEKTIIGRPAMRNIFHAPKSGNLTEEENIIIIVYFHTHKMV